MSSSSWYNQILTEVSTLTSFSLQKSLGDFTGLDRSLLSNLFHKKIIKNQNMRALIFYTGYCLAKGRLLPLQEISADEQILIAHATAAIEAENISTYYINHYLDNKGDIQNTNDAKNRVLAGLLSRNIAQTLIEKLKLDDTLKNGISQLIKQIDIDIAKAQAYDLNVAVFPNIHSFTSKAHFEKAYFERCKNLSGQFYGRAAEIGYIVGSRSLNPSPEKHMLSTYFSVMMALLQFANDIGDYAPPALHNGTVEKNFYKDFGSDLINQRLTLPNYLLLTKVSEPRDKELLNHIQCKGFLPDSLAQFMGLMNRLSIFSDCFTLLNTKFNQQKKALSLPHSDLRTLISSCSVIVRSNKLLCSIKKYIAEQR